MGWGVGSRIMVVVKLFVFGLNYILMEYFLVLLFSFYFFFVNVLFRFYCLLKIKMCLCGGGMGSRVGESFLEFESIFNVFGFMCFLRRILFFRLVLNKYFVIFYLFGRLKDNIYNIIFFR